MQRFIILMRKYWNIPWAIFRAFLLTGIGFILVYPIIFMVSMSFRTDSDVMDPGVVWIPKNYTLANLVMVLKAMQYWEALKNTLSIGMVSSILQIIICAFIGYGFARFKFKERNILFALLLFTILVPQQTLTIPTYLMYKDFDFFGLLKVFGFLSGGKASLNLLDTPYVFYLPALFGMGIRSGLYIFVYRQFFKGIPKELEEAAFIDGCGPLKTFLRVVVPNATPAILTVFLFSVVWYWNDYFHATMYMASRPMISTALANLQTSSILDVFRNNPFAFVNKLQCGALITILPLLVLYVFTQKYFTESIERTGIVG